LERLPALLLRSFPPSETESMPRLLPFLVLFIVASTATSTIATETEATETDAKETVAKETVAKEAERFFESQVRPLLIERCHKCHGGEMQKGQLRLDSRAAILAGGENGAAVVPGKPEESLVMEAIRHESFEMPPDGKLSDDEIAAIARWIELGAPWPGREDAGPDDAGPLVHKGSRTLSDDDRAWWAFQPVSRPEAPPAEQGASQHAIDRFIARRLAEEGLRLSPPADKATLLRRATFDLHGLPPTPEEIDAFLADDSPDAYEKLIDRLLESPRYGERWARHWLDLVRYAESDGYKQDDFRPTAWRYRDYVIGAFNSDKPYDEFIKEQLAGDELRPDDPEALIASGFLQLGIYEYNQRDVVTQWNAILNEITDVTADVFLAQGLQCARCHDHKYDPLLQKDYFRLRAYFEAYSPECDAPLGSAEELAAHADRLAAWEAKTAELRRELAEVEQPLRDSIAKAAIDKFPDDTREIMSKPAEARTPGEEQINDLAYRQVDLELVKIDFSKQLKGEKLDRWKALSEELAKFESERPTPLPTALAAGDISRIAPPTFIPGKRSAVPIEPGPLSVLDFEPAVIPEPSLAAKSTGRRRALAEWIASAENPLTARVMVNRIWQYHFGRGLVSTSSDFGHLGDLPSHPELLDYLASRFMDHGWSIKEMHRLMMTSAAYRQSSQPTHVAQGSLNDPANRLVWRQNLRRLDAEQIRDAILAATGELKLDAGGPSADAKEPRRTIYTKLYRNRRDALLDVFDVPDGIASMPQRNVTTTPLQSLLLVNSPWMLDRAKTLAAKVEKHAGDAMSERDDAEIAVQLYRRLYNRQPTDDEKALVAAFLANPTNRYTGDAAQARQKALIDLCHAMLNSSEFLFVD
jgi:mono/diheme cytochrome c family protein